jgi:hypothetical protein
LNGISSNVEVFLLRASPRRWFAGLLVIAACAGLLLAAVPGTVIHQDEYLVFRWSQSPLFEMLRYVTERDVHPPLWFSFFWFWRQMVGASEFAGRVQAVYFGLLALALTFRMGRDWFGAPRAGVFAAAALGVNALFFQYALEIRPYGAALFAASLSMWAYGRWLRRRSGFAAAVYGLTLPLMLYIHYFMGLLILTQLVHFFVLQRPDRRLLGQGGIALVVALALWLPWMPAFLNQIAYLRSVEVAAGTARGALGTGVTTRPTSLESVIDLIVNASSGQWALYGLVLIAGLWRLHRRAAYRLALMWALGLPVITFVLNTGLAVYAPRYIVSFTVGLALVCGAGLAALPGRSWAALAVFAGLSLWGLPGELPADRIPYRALYTQLVISARAGDVVLHDQAHWQDDMVRWIVGEVLPPEIGLTESFEAALPARRIWFVTANWFEPAVRDHYETLERTHPRQDGFGRCDRAWCYLLQLMEAPPFDQPRTFGETMTFWGADIDAISAEAIQTRLWWRVEQTPAVSYSIGLHLLGADGALVAQADGPVNHYRQGMIETSAFEPGRIYIDFRDLPLPSGLPAGEYQLSLTVYDWATGERLRLADGESYLMLDRLTLPQAGE